MDSTLVNVDSSQLEPTLRQLAAQIASEEAETPIYRFDSGGTVTEDTLAELLGALTDHPTTLSQWASVQSLIADGLQDATARRKLATALHRPGALAEADRVATASAIYLRNPELDLTPVLRHLNRLSPEAWSGLDAETVHRMAVAAQGLDQASRSQVQAAMSRFPSSAVAGISAADIAILYGQDASAVEKETTPTAPVRVTEDGEISLNMAQFSDRRQQIRDNLDPAPQGETEVLQVGPRQIHVWCILHYMSDRALFKEKAAQYSCAAELEGWLTTAQSWDGQALLNQMASGSDKSFAKDSRFYTNLYGVTLTMAEHVRRAAKELGADPAARRAIMKTAGRVQDWSYMVIKILDAYMIKYSIVAPELSESNLVLVYIGQQMSLLQLTHGQSHQKLTALEAQLAREVKTQIKTLARLHGLQGERISLSSLPADDSAEIRNGMRLLAELKKENQKLTASVDKITADAKGLQSVVPTSVRKRLE